MLFLNVVFLVFRFEKMALLCWFAKSNAHLENKFDEPNFPGLPNPHEAAASAEGKACEAVNKEIKKTIFSVAKATTK